MRQNKGKRPTKLIVHRTASEAWSYFRDKCGLEPEGRDADLIAHLWAKLDPNAPGLDAAVARVSNTTLVRAIFECVAPFVSMSRDILAFFRRAEARRGPGQWALTIEDVPLELLDFVEFIKASERAWGVVDVPYLTWRDAWELWRILGEAPTSYVARDVTGWLSTFKTEKTYAPWPASFDRDVLPLELHDVALVLQTSLTIIRDLKETREQLIRRRTSITGPEPIYDAPILAMIETDYWLAGCIERLGQAARLATPEMNQLGDKLADFFGRLPRILLPRDTALDTLEQILSLPVWQKRHEAYAVWIATQVVQCFPPKRIEVHHDNGAVVFAFKKTKVATAEIPGGKVILYAERKQPLNRPLGAGRRRNVQPDFGLWTEHGVQSRCLLVVEVKHYAQVATRKFTEVLIDYARAHAEAEVVLVNYGPTADMLDQLDERENPVAPRCHHIGQLTPLNRVACDRFAAFVQSVIKETEKQAGHLLVDISSSMKGFLLGEEFRSWLHGDENKNIGAVTLADHRRVWEGPLDDTCTQIAAHNDWSVEHLEPVVRQLLMERSEIRLVTDITGLEPLSLAEDLEVDVQSIGLEFRTGTIRLRHS